MIWPRRCVHSRSCRGPSVCYLLVLTRVKPTYKSDMVRIKAHHILGDLSSGSKNAIFEDVRANIVSSRLPYPLAIICQRVAQAGRAEAVRHTVRRMQCLMLFGGIACRLWRSGDTGIDGGAAKFSTNVSACRLVFPLSFSGRWNSHRQWHSISRTAFWNRSMLLSWA